VIELKHVLLAENAIINSLTGGQLSVINLINAVKTPNLPQEINQIFLVMNWQRDRKEKAEDVKFNVRVRIKHEDKFIKQVAEIPNVTVEIPKDQYIVNTVGAMNLKVTEDGEYRIIVEKMTDDKWKEVGSVSVEVVVTDAK
jgi:hypothetical protein